MEYTYTLRAKLLRFLRLIFSGNHTVRKKYEKYEPLYYVK